MAKGWAYLSIVYRTELEGMLETVCTSLSPPFHRRLSDKLKQEEIPSMSLRYIAGTTRSEQ